MADDERIQSELNVIGSIDDEGMANAAVVRLMEDVIEHGEVHAEFADDSARYVEVRKGTTEFDFEGGVFAIDDGITKHRFAMAQLSNWHKPRNVFEESE